MATVTKREGKNGTTYRLRSSVGYTADGRQVMKSKTWTPKPGMTKQQIEKELNRQMVLFDEECAAQGVGSGNIKFETFARQWITEYAEANLRPRTVYRLHQMEERTYTALGHLRLDTITARHVQKFINNLAEPGISGVKDTAKATPLLLELMKGRTQRSLSDETGVSRHVLSIIGKGEAVSIATAEKLSKGMGKPVSDLFTVTRSKDTLSPKTIKHYLTFVSDVMQYAVRMGMIQDNPCRGGRVTVPKAPPTEREVYTLEEAQRFLESLEQAPVKYKAFFTLAIYGGLRRGELLGLEWKDLDFTDHIIHIRRTSLYLADRGTYTDTTKTAQSTRTLKLPAAVFDVLRQLRGQQAEERLKMGDLWQGEDRLFTNLDGKPLFPNTPYNWLQKFCKNTGQRFLGVHAFRHLNASLLIDAGADVTLVSKSLGHSQVSTTLNIYSHSFQEAQARASEAVADLLTIGKKA